MDFSTLSLYVATPEQTEVSRRRTGVTPWGNGMTLDEYLQRDLGLEKSECGRDGKYITWVLAPRSDPGTLDFLCSCETFRRSGLVARTSPDFLSSEQEKQSEAAVEEVVCYGIASVFTPPENRGKGYAHLTMSLLHWVLAGEVLPADAFPSHIWGPPPVPPPGMGKAAFSALWSDVGDFYETCNPDSTDRSRRSGWIVRGTRTTKWYPRSKLDTGTDRESEYKGQAGSWIWLSEEQVNEATIHDAERMHTDLPLHWSHSEGRTKILFTFLPSRGVEAFQRERLKHFWEKERINRWGVALFGESSRDSKKLDTIEAFATWTLELRPPAPRTLVVTRLHAPHSGHFAEIMQRIWQYSIDHDIKAVEIWNCPPHLRDAGYREARRWFEPLGGEENEDFERKEHLPAFKWYGRGGSESQLAEGEVEWAYNEKCVTALNAFH